MKRIGITQRVEFVQNYAERRDCLDQRWAAFIWELNCLPIPLPNISTERVSTIVGGLKLDAILLSGGNSISELEPGAVNAAPERDAFEFALLDEGLSQNIPVFGICRGMQIINLYFGGKLTNIKDHVAVRHPIFPEDSEFHLPETVNSYHNWGILPEGLAHQLSMVAHDSEGNVEAFCHREKKVYGIMWHPEREYPSNHRDIELFRKVFL